MAVWSGLGVNYKGVPANWAVDSDYFKSIGLKYIRLHLDPIIYPFNKDNTGMKYWRDAAIWWSNAGFLVNWGASAITTAQTAGTLTATIWNDWHDAMVAEAAYCQSIGLKLFAFEIGNEAEPRCDGTTLTIDQFIVNTKQLAADVKAVYNLGKVCYSNYDYLGTTYNKWIAAGLGPLDYLGVHPYGNAANNFKNLKPGGYPAALNAVTQLGASRCIVTEFNLDAGDANIVAMQDDMKVTRMREKYKYLKDAGFTVMHVYSYVGYNNQDNQFAMKNTDGSFNAYWDVLQTNNGRRTFVD